MGLFSKDEEVSAYERVRLNLAEKDGNFIATRAIPLILIVFCKECNRMVLK